MSVYKPAKGRFWHYDFQLKGRRYYGSTGSETRKGAERAERRNRELAGLGELGRAPDPVPTLDQAAAAWWLTKQHLDTAEALQLQAAQLVEWIGPSKPVNEVTHSDIERAIQKRRGHLVKGKTVPTPATVNRTIIAVARPILKHARTSLNDGSRPLVPFPEINWSALRQKEPRTKRTELSDPQMAALVAELPPELHDFAAFVARYGPRLGEMFFRPEEVDVKGKRVRLRDRKGGDDHVIPLLDDDASMLAARVGRAQAAKLRTVWFREEGKKLFALEYEEVRNAFRRAFVRSGLKASRGLGGIHKLRHHAGMKTLRGSKDLRAVQRLLGHASIASTMVYAHADEDAVRSALAETSRPVPEPPAATTSEEDVAKAGT